LVTAVTAYSPDVLSDRERRALMVIEQQLASGDPEFVRIFRAPVRPSAGVLLARVLMVLGLALVVLGSATVALPVAALGTAVTLGGSLLMVPRGRDATGLDPAT
jgi:hypothetical protein